MSIRKEYDDRWNSQLTPEAQATIAKRDGRNTQRDCATCGHGKGAWVHSIAHPATQGNPEVHVFVFPENEKLVVPTQEPESPCRKCGGPAWSYKHSTEDPAFRAIKSLHHYVEELS